MSSMWGNKVKISIFGESHGNCVGVVVDGLEPGLKIDFEKLNLLLKRRKPGGKLTTPRKEDDEFQIMSGVKNGTVTGAPLSALTYNKNFNDKDYEELEKVARPSHSDYPAYIKYKGFNDLSGGGHFSARLTAPLVFAGGIAMQYLEQKGIKVFSHIYSVGGIKDQPFDGTDTEKYYEILKEKTLKVLDDKAGADMLECIEKVQKEGDSVGGIVECAVTGLEVGIGNPIFGNLESVISSIIFAVPAIKGIEFGAGFSIADMKGSEANDLYIIKDGKIKTSSNNNGGILGGLSDGMPLILRTAFKPTPSIFKKQKSVAMVNLKETELLIKGRHDPCVALRGSVCIEAAVALAVYDSIRSL